MKYVTLYYKDSLKVAREFICKSFKETNRNFEFNNVNFMQGYELSDGRTTSKKLNCSSVDYDVVICHHCFSALKDHD